MNKEVPLRLLLVVAAAGFFLAIAKDGGTALAAPKIELTLILCDGGAPEHSGKFDLIYLHNEGDAPQDLTGWKLKSDPEDSQVMSLDVAGTLNPVAERGAEPKHDTPRAIIVAGQHAVNLPGSRTWLWSNSEILRDTGEPIDHVRLYDPAGNLVDSKDCSGNPVPLPTTAAVATATPSPQPPSGSNQPGDSTGGSTQPENQNTTAVETQTRGSTSSQASTGSQTSASAPVSATGGSVPAPNSGVGSLAPVNATAWPLTAGALALGFVGLIIGTALLRRRGKQDV